MTRKPMNVMTVLCGAGRRRGSAGVPFRIPAGTTAEEMRHELAELKRAIAESNAMTPEQRRAARESESR